MLLCAVEQPFERLEADSGVFLVFHHTGVIVLDERIAHLLDMFDDWHAIGFRRK